MNYVACCGQPCDVTAAPLRLCSAAPARCPNLCGLCLRRASHETAFPLLWNTGVVAASVVHQRNQYKMRVHRNPTAWGTLCQDNLVRSPLALGECLQDQRHLSHSRPSASSHFGKDSVPSARS